MIFLLNQCHSKGEKSMRENHGQNTWKSDFFCMISPTLKPGSHLPKKLSYLRDWEPFKNDEKCFYFVSKAFFVLKIFKFLSRHFGHRKNSLIRKISSTSKFMTPHLGLQTIPVQILPNISQCKGNQTMKFGQLIEHNKRNIFFKNYAEYEVGRLVPGHFLFFKNLNMRYKQVDFSLV